MKAEQLSLAAASYARWKQSCLSYATALSTSPETSPKTLVSSNEYIQMRNAFIAVYDKQLTDPKKWVSSTKNPSKELLSFQFNPYVQKIKVSPGATLTIIGDLHGDLVSLINALDTLKDKGILDEQCKLKNAHYLIFLGDYTDRGPCGVEILFTLFKLKIANPDQVILLRGNHEDACINEFGGTFGKELQEKFGLLSWPERQKFIYNVYELLPVALYLGSDTNDYMLLCHGGLEIGFDPSPLLQGPTATTLMKLETLDRTKALTLLPQDTQTLKVNIHTPLTNDTSVPKAPSDLHFLWNDFHEGLSTFFNFTRGAGWDYGELLTDALLKRGSIKTLIRGHNHALALQGGGLYCLYTNNVITLTSFRRLGPSEFFKHYSFITMTLKPSPGTWELWHERDSLSSIIK